jgi:hypothetical protein
MPRIISPGGDDDFRSLSPKLFNAGQAGPKWDGIGKRSGQTKSNLGHAELLR